MKHCDMPGFSSRQPACLWRQRAQKPPVFEDATHRAPQAQGFQHNPQRENRGPSDHQADVARPWHQAG